jgi:hypothetical protein
MSMFVASDPPEHALLPEVVEFVTATRPPPLDTTFLARRFGVSSTGCSSITSGCRRADSSVTPASRPPPACFAPPHR